MDFHFIGMPRGGFDGRGRLVIQTLKHLFSNKITINYEKKFLLVRW